MLPSTPTKNLKKSVYEALGDGVPGTRPPRPARSRAPGSTSSVSTKTRTRRSSRASSAGVRYSLAELDDYFDGAIPVRAELFLPLVFPRVSFLTQPYFRPYMCCAATAPSLQLVRRRAQRSPRPSSSPSIVLVVACPPADAHIHRVALAAEHNNRDNTFATAPPFCRRYRRSSPFFNAFPGPGSREGSSSRLLQPPP